MSKIIEFDPTNIINDDKLLRDFNYTDIDELINDKIDEIYKKEAENLTNQKIEVSIYKDSPNLFITTSDFKDINTIYLNYIVYDLDSTGNIIYDDFTKNKHDINSAKEKIIIKYLISKGVKKYEVRKDKFIIKFICPICSSYEKHEMKCWITLGTFKIKSFSNNDCNNETHFSIWKKWTKEIKTLWDESKEKETLCFNMNKTYLYNIIENKFPKIVRYNNSLYYYCTTDLHYKPVIDNKVYSDVNKWITQNFIKDNDVKLSSKDINDVRNIVLFDYDFPIIYKINDDNYINCENGVYDIKNDKLYNHSNKFYLTYKVPVKYDKTAYSKELYEIVLGWGIDILELKKMLGYCFQSDCSLEKGFYLKGKAGSGKSTLISMISLIFQQKIYSMAVSKLYEPHGLGFGIKDRTCLIDNDFDNKTFLKCNVKTYNNILEGATFILNEKYKPQEEYKSTMKYIIACNEYPRFKAEDDNGGFYRRMYVFEFNKQFKEDDNRDNSIKKRFINDDIMKSTFLNLILEGLTMYLNHDMRKPFFKTQYEMIALIERESEPTIGYVQDNLIVVDDNDCYLESNIIYQHYLNWCYENFITHPVSSNTLSKKIRIVLNLDNSQFSQTKKLNGKSVKIHKGVKFANLEINVTI